MNWTTSDSRFGLSISDAAWASIAKACQESLTTETGGILIGHYLENRTIADVREATLPPADSQRSALMFRRGVAGLSEKLANQWWSNPRLHYLGEWHFHPAGWPYPSQTDIEQMRAISEDANYSCREPILVVVALGTASCLDTQAFIFPRGEAYQPMFRTSA